MFLKRFIVMKVVSMEVTYVTIGVLFLTSLCTSETLPGNRTNFDKCKVSHLGIDYQGDISKTESGVRCQSWSSDAPVHKVNAAFTDGKFPDGQRKLAKSSCRNPNKDAKGPWCYTLDPSLIDDTCAVPLCSLTECKVTGPGMEYAGTHNRGVSGK